MNVVEAPDILYNQTSNDTIVAEGASVVLRCEARGFPEPSISWKRADRRPIVLRNAKGSVIRGKRPFIGIPFGDPLSEIYQSYIK